MVATTATDTVRVPTAWKGPITTLKNSMDADDGAVLLQQLSDLPGDASGQLVAVPAALVGYFLRVVELYQEQPDLARQRMVAAAAAAPPPPVADRRIWFRFENEFLGKVTFEHGGSLESFKVDKPYLMLPSEIERFEDAIAAMPKYLPGGRPSASAATRIVRLGSAASYTPEY